MHQTKTGILLANLGTPDAPTPGAVKRYLRQFLSDKRVVDTSRLLWWPLLRGVILPIRSPRVAKPVSVRVDGRGIAADGV
ncbi:ferrochelatase [Klebsiella pneumoniae]|uniref:Ferrochelatase n=1 Tax=Klebsiella pneumoniae TaxID=573 RepID=A0A377W8F4_KLEPN|nr:ferrochelatase [Klebsiella pneumoniae]